jgi:hypothetical protein
MHVFVYALVQNIGEVAYMELHMHAVATDVLCCVT